jgi:hypothetical protein
MVVVVGIAQRPSGVVGVAREGVWRQRVVRHDPARYRAEPPMAPDTMDRGAPPAKIHPL